MSSIEYFWLENVSQEAISDGDPLPNEECILPLSIEQLPLDDNLFEGLEGLPNDISSYLQRKF